LNFFKNYLNIFIINPETSVRKHLPACGRQACLPQAGEYRNILKNLDSSLGRNDKNERV